MTSKLPRPLYAAREQLSATGASLSEAARESANGAGVRMGAAYNKVRSQVAQATVEPRRRVHDLLQGGAANATSLADSGLELSAHAFKQGRQALDRASVASRGLIAERPLTAVAIGITAGVVLGFLANRLSSLRSRSDAENGAADEDSPD